MKFKVLFLKFGYLRLQSECERKGWRIPTLKELHQCDKKIPHKWVWTSNKHEDDRLGYVMHVETGEIHEFNLNNMEHAVVIIDDGRITREKVYHEVFAERYEYWIGAFSEVRMLMNEKLTLEDNAKRRANIDTVILCERVYQEKIKASRSQDSCSTNS